MADPLATPRHPGRLFDLVLLDRDGTLNERRPGRYVEDPDDLVLLPGAAASVARLGAVAGRVVVVTNQQGLATGRLDHAGYAAVTQRLHDLLAAEGAIVDAVLVCPHREGTCGCRKPAPGLFIEALRRAPWAVPARCVMVGDMPTDVAPARELGMRGMLLGPRQPSLAVVTDRLLTDGAHESDVYDE